MVSKCANPACNVPFLYFHQGKLFRRERAARPQGGNGNGSKRGYVEFYWLCNDCADKMTLVFEKDVGISVRPHPMAHATAA